MALVKEYFALHKKHSQDYGEKTMVLMQVGAFFEVYGLRDKNGVISDSNIEAFSQICDLVMANKKSSVNGKDVLMSGFRDYMLDKYLKRLQENQYTSCVYTQDTPTKNTTRSLTSIYSPGTFFASDSQVMSNNTTCVWFMESKHNIHIGISNVDIFTGKTNAFEFHVPQYHNPTAYDELERYISIHDPAEIILIYTMKEDKMKEIIEFVGASNRCLRHVKLGNKSDKKQGDLVEVAFRCEKQTYQEEILQRFDLSIDSDDISPFQEHTLCTQSLCFLLDYVYRHNPDLVNRIEHPTFENNTARMILANHSLKQLNMIDDAQFSGKLSSVSRFLNNCLTTMGKRNFHYKILNPTTDIDSLNRSFTLTEYILKNVSIEDTRSSLRRIRDLEKLERKRLLRKVTPCDFYSLHNNLSIIQDLLKSIKKDDTLCDGLKRAACIDVDVKQLINYCKEIETFLKDSLDLDKCKELDTLNFDKSTTSDESTVTINFVKSGVSKLIDNRVRASLESRDKLEAIRALLDDVVKKYEKKSLATEFIKVHETPTLGVSLQATKRRAQIAMKEMYNEIGLLSPGKEHTIGYISRYDNENKCYDLDVNELTRVDATGSSCMITSPQIKELCNEIRCSKEALIDAISSFYKDFMVSFDKYADQILKIARFITWLDIYCCQAYNARKYNYCRPVIEQAEKSFIRVEGLRHCLIEHLQTRELYVTNDISLGESSNGGLDGMLLYGTNAVGKTSLIRALGISCILAQSGMFVPATTMTFCPYNCLFTRILGNDNLFKGMSTFAVEMSELRSILRLSDAKSLTLGDELCSGTESDSAKSIFVAGLEDLTSKKGSFLFATHFHELVQYDEVKQLNTVGMFHMSVRYDKKSGKLIYDRKLKTGPGDSMYGLEVCKALQLPDGFLERAHAIRMKYHSEHKPTEILTTSRYNSKKILGKCELCKKADAVDVHHLQYQKDANEEGFIGSFHKNHLANLASLCKKCHNTIHSKNMVYKKVKTSMGHELEEMSS
jgi:DNA mismatch repair protein MutS